jgi:hypothetical protein
MEAFDTYTSLSNDCLAHNDQTTEVIQSYVCGKVAEPFSNTVTVLCIIGRVNFIFENRLVSQ